MGAGVRRAGRRSELSQMEATSPTVTAGLADATGLPSRLPLYGTDGADELIKGWRTIAATDRAHTLPLRP